MKTLIMKPYATGIAQMQLLQGEFSKQDALELITQFIHVKIRYHEDKIKQSSNEEDMKMRESRIKQLQRDLYEIRSELEKKTSAVSLNALINIE